MSAHVVINMLQILDEFVEAVMSRWPKTVLQFEDFQLQYAHPLLQRYKDQHLVFNDDIQVTFLMSSVLKCLPPHLKSIQLVHATIIFLEQ